MSERRFQIRLASINDRERLIEFGKTEFTRTFGHLYTTQDLETYLLEGYDPALYENWLTDDNYRIFLAHHEENQNHIIGYVLFGPCTLPLENCGYDSSYAETCREIKRLYIYPDFFGTAVSSSLLRQALDVLVEKGFQERIFLGVYSENPRAIRFYSKYGFKHIGEYGFVVGDQIDREFIFQWSGFEKTT